MRIVKYSWGTYLEHFLLLFAITKNNTTRGTDHADIHIPARASTYEWLKVTAQHSALYVIKQAPKHQRRALCLQTLCHLSTKYLIY